MGNIPVTTTSKISPKALRYKWEAYCNTNGRRTAIQMGGVLTVFPFPWSLGVTKSTAMQIGGVLQYKWKVYCDTSLRSSGGWVFCYFASSPEKFCEYFFRICLGILHWKMAGIFGEFFLVSVSHETKHENSSKNSGKIRREIRGKIRDKNLKNSGNFRSATFLT